MTPTPSSSKRKRKAVDEAQTSEKEETSTDPKTPLAEMSKRKKTKKQKENSAGIQSVINLVENMKTSNKSTPRPTPPEETQTPAANNKGKQRQQEESDEMKSDSDEDSDDSEIEIDLCGGFEVLETDRRANIGERRPNELIMTFDEQPELYFNDHMAPYRGIMGEIRRESAAFKGETIMKLYNDSPQKKLLVATTGYNFSQESRRSIVFAIFKILGKEPKEVIPIRKSQWAIVEVEKNRDVKTLLRQTVVFDPARNVLVVFRAPVFKVPDDRVFEIVNVKFKEDLIDFRKEIEGQGAKIVEQKPRTEDWKSTYTNRVIWKVKAPTKTWTCIGISVTKQGTQLAIQQSPLCGTCQADDHHNTACEWKAIFPSLSTQPKQFR
jgi:hypothetical protein